MMDELIWIACNTLFPIALILNYFFSKRWKERSVFERVLFWIFLICITYTNCVTSVLFYKIKESISETLGALQVGDYHEQYHYHVNYIYCFALMILALGLLMDTFAKAKRRKVLPCLSYTVLGSGFVISLVYYFFFTPHAFERYDIGIAVTYLFLYATLSVFISYYLFRNTGKKLVTKIMLTLGTVAFATEVISLTIQFSLQSVVYYLIIDFVLIGFIGIYDSETKKGVYSTRKRAISR